MSEAFAVRISHVIFDLDGTLIDSKDDLACAVNVALRSLSLEAKNPADLYGYIGSGARVLVEKALGPENSRLLEEAVDLFLDYYRRHLLDRTRPYPGVMELLAELSRKGLRVTLLTNKPADLTEKIIEGLGLRRTFSAVVAGDTLPMKKPDPSGALHLCRVVGAQAHQSIVVGDSAIDVETAKAAGAKSCGVTWGFGGAKVAQARPDYLIHAPSELLPLLL